MNFTGLIAAVCAVVAGAVCVSKISSNNKAKIKFAENDDDFASLSGWPLLGNLLDIISFGQAKKLSEITVPVWLSPPGMVRRLAIFDPLITRRVLGTNTPNIALLGSRQYAAFLGPSSVFGLAGLEHKRVRGLSAKAVSKSTVRLYFENIKRLSKDTVESMAADSNGSKPIDVNKYFEKFAYDSICAFMVASESANGKILSGLYIEYMRFAAGLTAVVFPHWMDFNDDIKKGIQARAKISEKLKIIISERRQELENGIEFADALSMFIESRDSEGNFLTNDDIVNLFFALQFAGFETTSKQLATMYYQLTHCISQTDLQLLRQEVSQPSALESEQLLSALPTLDAFIKESMRALPVLPAFAHIFLEDITIDGKLIKSGVTVAPYRDRTMFSVENSEIFKLERFLGENAFDKTNAAEYMPFGYGDRMCLGMHLAKMEMKLLIAVTLKSFELEKSGNKVKFTRYPTQFARCK
ncbi:hypothetical protein HK100_008251, partial [Physocladia obscura]